MAQLLSPFVRDLEQTLDWSITRDQIQNASTGGVIDGMIALTNTKTKKEIYVTNKTYQQTNPEFFMDIANQIAIKTGMELLGYHTFCGGEKILGYFRNVNVEEHYRKILKLQNESFLVIGTGNDGKDPFFVGTSEFILRCKNQWGRVNKNLKFKHTKNHEYAIQSFVNSIELQKVSDLKLIEKFERMQKIKVDNDLLLSIVDRFLEIERPVSKEELTTFKLPTRTQNNLEQILSSMEIERKDLGQNLFGTFNGFTHYISHVWNGTNANSAPGNLLNGYERQTDKAFNVVDHFYQSLA
jgi:hypothetical protein